MVCLWQKNDSYSAIFSHVHSLKMMFAVVDNVKATDWAMGFAKTNIVPEIVFMHFLLMN